MARANFASALCSAAVKLAFTSQILTVRSREPEKSVLPSRLNASEVAALSWRSVSVIGWPDGEFHTLTVPSYAAVATRLLTGSNATAVTGASCKSGSPNGRPVATSQIEAVWSSDPVTRYCPAGLNARSVIAFLCDIRCSSLPEIDQRLTAPSRWPVAIASPVGAKRADVISDSVPNAAPADSAVTALHNRTLPSHPVVMNNLPSRLNSIALMCGSCRSGSPILCLEDVCQSCATPFSVAVENNYSSVLKATLSIVVALISGASTTATDRVSQT